MAYKAKKRHVFSVVDRKDPRWRRLKKLALDCLKARRGKHFNKNMKPVQKVFRSQYKPCIPSVRVFDHINVNAKIKAYYRVDDLKYQEGRVPYRLKLFSKSSFLTMTSFEYRALVHYGKGFIGGTFISKEQVGHRIGEFIRTKRMGNVHKDNKVQKKLRKRRAQLRLEAQRRKRRKKKKVVRPTHNKKIVKHAWVKKQKQTTAAQKSKQRKNIKKK